MEVQQIADYRLQSQNISPKSSLWPEEVVARLGAMQAQDYPAALWAIALRCKDGTTKSDVESSIENRKIVRSWLMRGTLHFASGSDIRWMLGLFGPRLLNTAIKRDRLLGLSNENIRLTKSILTNSLSGGNQLTREEIYKTLNKKGIITSNNMGYHMLYRAAWDGLICFGAHEGKDATIALIDEWIPKAAKLKPEDALAELTSRYFIAHGPATIQDYLWWSGLRVQDAKLGIEKSLSSIREVIVEGKKYYMSKKKSTLDDNRRVHLLPAFDEYLVGYRDRSAALRNKGTQKILKSGKMTFVHSNGIFQPIIVIEGQVVGIWRRKQEKEKHIIVVMPFTKFTDKDMKGIKDAAERYGNFLEKEVALKYVKV